MLGLLLMLLGLLLWPLLGLLTGFKITIFTEVLRDGENQKKQQRSFLEPFNSSKTLFPKDNQKRQQGSAHPKSGDKEHQFPNQ